MREKKKGSSLITVVIIFSVLITVGTALLSMTVGDYKMRVKESKNIENLYASESGLDVAYDIIVKTFDGAAKFGDFKAKQLKDEKCNDGYKQGPNAEKYKEEKEKLKKAIKDIEKKHANEKNNTKKCSCEKEKKALQKKFDEFVEKLSKEEFKRCFRNFILKSNDSSEVSDSENIPQNIIGECICNAQYINIELNDTNHKVVSKDFGDDNNNNSNDNDNTDKIKKTVTFKGNSKPELFVCSDEELERINELEKKIKDDKSENEELKNLKKINGGIKYIVDNSEEDKGHFEIKVTSKFKSKNGNTDIIGENLRTLQAKYEIEVPEYKDISFKESTVVVDYDTVKDIPMIVGGNMEVNREGYSNKGTLDVNGDIFVQGSKKDIKNKVYDKYEGGININESDVTFEGSVSTASTFLIQDDSDVKIEKNSKVKESGKIANLYALNVYVGKLDGKYANDYNGGKSSSLDVSNGAVVVDNDLAIKAMNTNIKIKDFYGLNDKNISRNNNTNLDSTLERTASSIIVNGNKESGVKITDSAYIMGVAHIDNPQNQDNPYTTGESTAVKGNYIAYATDENDQYNVSNFMDGDVKDKAEKFNEYWRNKIEIVDTGGIELPDKTYSPGAIVYKSRNNVVVKCGEPIEKIEEPVIRPKRIEYASKVYNLGKDVDYNDYKSLGYNSEGKEINPIDKIMNLYNISDTYQLKEQTESEKAIFNNDENKVIIIKNDSSKEGQVEEDENNIYVYTNGGIVNAFIATVGDVIIDGEVNLKGNIITEKNLIIKGNGNKTITYDNEVIKDIYNNNKELFNKVFVDDVSNSSGEETKEAFLNVEYDLNKFIHNRLWKIKK